MPENKVIIDNDVCMNCKHFWGNTACDAFPDGIPAEIMHGENQHTKPLPGQENNIVFEPFED